MDDALDVSRETRDRLAVFVDLLVRWNGRVNLVGKADLSAIWRRHIADSLQLTPLMGPGDAPCLDIGSGAGFPGLVLAIATGRPFTLVESDTRKAAFLIEASRLSHAPTHVLARRIAEVPGRGVTLITARAVAPLARLLEMATPHLARDGQCLFLKGRTADQELVVARKVWHMRCQRIPSRVDPEGCVLHLSEIVRVDRHT